MDKRKATLYACVYTSSKVVLPSYQRSYNFITLPLHEKTPLITNEMTIICVRDREKELAEEHNSKGRRLPHTAENIKGLTNTLTDKHVSSLQLDNPPLW